MNKRVKLALVFVAIVAAVFLAGFLPEYLRANGLQQRVQQADQQLAASRVRDLSGMTFLQTSLKNYGLASRYATELFDSAKSLAARTESPDLRQALQTVLAQRDTITAQLARGDQAAYSSVQAAYQTLITLGVGAP
jgi:hypothetical protein